ncbi:ribonuclease H-like YkuK family protein [Anaerobacillus sp. MEB173]|uniref:ribonuclease H-like YkuK family protein n=1 Tax=Anaerobacillus sp. MEB173 TaxID=3383345 RepID=UPI003F916744
MIEDTIFYNLSNEKMEFLQVYKNIEQFVKSDPTAMYRLAIGTDSHVHKEGTRFITAIHLHRLGKGAWGCLQKRIIKKQLSSVHEKILLETKFSQEIATLFTADHLAQLAEIVAPYSGKGGGLVFEIHLDIGKNGLTKEFIKEMTERIAASGLHAKIKPESYAASSYANKFTK